MLLTYFLCQCGRISVQINFCICNRLKNGVGSEAQNGFKTSREQEKTM